MSNTDIDKQENGKIKGNYWRTTIEIAKQEKKEYI